MLLLKDGVRYFPYEYASEQELTHMVIEHYKEIFGPNTVYFDPPTMRTKIGVVARSDGIIVAPDNRQWYILEVELAEHSARSHIVPQITDFNIIYQQPETRRKITAALYDSIKQDPYKMITFQSKVEDIHKYLTETVETAPTIAVITDEKTARLEAACKNLPFQARITEFKTYTRENAGLNVHVHEFEPMCEKRIRSKTLASVLTVLEQVYKRGKTYDEAARIVARKLKLQERDVRHRCTIDIGLTSGQLRKLLRNKEKLKAFIIGKFPEDEEAVREVLL